MRRKKTLRLGRVMPKMIPQIMTLTCLALMIVLGMAVYQLKYKVMALESQLAETNQSIYEENQALQVYQAEWQYLTSPQRLADINKKKLGLQPVGTHQIQTLNILQRASFEDTGKNLDASEINRQTYINGWIQTSTPWE